MLKMKDKKEYLQVKEKIKEHDHFASYFRGWMEKIIKRHIEQTPLLDLKKMYWRSIKNKNALFMYHEMPLVTNKMWEVIHAKCPDIHMNSTIQDIFNTLPEYIQRRIYYAFLVYRETK